MVTNFLIIIFCRYNAKNRFPGEVYNARKGGRKEEEDEQQDGYTNNGYTVGRPGKSG